MYLGTQPAIGQNRKLDSIAASFNGVLTTFSLTVNTQSVVPSNVYQLFISLGGVLQDPGVDFTANGNQITFTTAPVSGLTFFGVFQGDSITGTPTIADASITTLKLATGLTITNTAGTAGAPSVTFAGDTNTGIYSPGADQVAITTGGTGRLFVDSSGRLLVGTSTARSNFFGTTLSSLTQTEGTGGSTARGSLSVINNDVSNNPPYVLLGRSGAATLGSNAVVVSGSRLGTLTFHGADGTSFIEAATVAGEVDGTPGTNDMPGRLVFSTTADGAASPTERLRIDSSGRVGVGTSAPQGLITLSKGTGNIAPTSVTAANSFINIGFAEYGSASNGKYMVSYGYSSGATNAPAYIGLEQTSTGSYTCGDLTFYTRSVTTDTAPTERLRITNGGLVGIGTSGPTANFQVSHTSTAPSLSSFAGSAATFNGSSSIRLSFGTYPAPSYTSWIQSADASGNAYPLLLQPLGGNVGIGVTAPDTTTHIKGAWVSNTGQLRVDANSGETYAGISLANNGSSKALIYHNNSTNAFYLGTATASGVITFNDTTGERARLDSSGRWLVGTSSTSAVCRALFQGHSSDANSGAFLYLTRGDTAPADGSGLGSINFADSGHTTAATISVNRDGGTWTSGSSQPTRLTFSTTASGSASPTERMRITSGGSVFIGTTTATYPNPGIGLYPTGYAELGNNAGTAGTGFFGFARSNVLIGSITQSGTTGVAYNTSSDYRLKENVEPINGAVERILRLKPSRFNFIADPDITVDGFIAHEAQAVVPEAVHGSKDEVDEDGNPVYQGIDQSKLVPLLTAALQEAVAEIKALKDRVTALEGA